MKCLENHTIKQVKEMSNEELIELWERIAKEKQAMDIRVTVVDMLEIMEDNKSEIES